MVKMPMPIQVNHYQCNWKLVHWLFWNRSSMV